jgi:hypothetical protein
MSACASATQNMKYGVMYIKATGNIFGSLKSLKEMTHTNFEIETMDTPTYIFCDKGKMAREISFSMFKKFAPDHIIQEIPKNVKILTVSYYVDNFSM